ncbi:hypothetical protein AB0G02_28820, partial [Actinosynnema sp. NPDC023658]|uniref:hypothetical protein n=1 Tax=Actinosynnema sp. NPDC023658 TaxID=3155465 RepID=UPI0034074D3C
EVAGRVATAASGLAVGHPGGRTDLTGLSPRTADVGQAFGSATAARVGPLGRMGVGLSGRLRRVTAR